MKAAELVTLLTLVAGLVACGPAAVETPQPTPVPATEAAATEAPATEVPPTNVPPTEVPPTEEPAPVGLTVGLSADAESMDPFFVNQAAGWSVVHALFDHLIERDFESEIVPGLAKSWTVVDETTLEFQLREDVTFHNGEPFDAESVKFSVERMLGEEEAPNRGKFTSIDAVEIVDAYTVRFLLNRPDGTLFDSLTSRLAMLPPQYFEEVGPQGFGERPVGTGPFEFVEWVPDSHATVTANEDYWEGSYKGQPEVAQVTFRPIPEPATRAAELETGGIDVMQDVSTDQIATLEAAGMEVIPDIAYQLSYVFFKTDDETLPTSDIRVRRALNYAVDVPTIIDTLLGGYGEPIGSPIGPGYLGYNPEVEPYPYDVERAQELLAEAGYPDGFSSTMDTSSDGRTDVAQAVAGQLADVGVEMTVREVELGQFNQNWMGGTQSPMWRARWGNTPDPQSIELFASCNGWISRYCNEEVTEKLEAARDTLDQEERAKLYSEASQLMHDDPLGIYLFTAAQIYGLNPRVENFRPSPLLGIIVSGVSVSE
jgi:peptide/nickel transport system substrate-binding protein